MVSTLNHFNVKFHRMRDLSGRIRKRRFDRLGDGLDLTESQLLSMWLSVYKLCSRAMFYGLD